MLTGDLTKAIAYEEQAKVITDKLSELRGLSGQQQERSAITGDFNARAFQAKIGRAADNLPKKQLEKLGEIKETLDDMLRVYTPPSIYVKD